MRKSYTKISSTSMGKRVSALALAFCCAVSGLGMRPTDVRAADGGTEVTINGQSVSIGNSFISREYSIADGHIQTAKVLNKRIGKEIVPQSGSQDFVINTISAGATEKDPETEVVKPTGKLQSTGWTVTLKNNAGTAFAESQVATLTDGKTDTYVTDSTIKGLPFTLLIDLGSTQTVRSFSVDKRPGYKEEAYGINGTMGKYEVKVSTDGKSYTTAAQGEFTREAWNLHTTGEGDAKLYNVGDTVYANLDKAYQVRYVQIIQKSDALGNTAEFSNSEIGLYSDAYTGPDWNKAPETDSADMITPSKLEYETAAATDNQDANGQTDGKILRISYKPYLLNGVTYDIDQVVVLKDNDFYMNSWLEIVVSDKAKAQIDYIDTDHFVLSSDAVTWSHPDESQISSQWIKPHKLMLGQPVYANGMFMGSEFPATDTRISDGNVTQIRYYSGKTFDQMQKDNQLTKDGKFVSWHNVIGAAQGTDTAVVQTDFFQYIEEIATPTQFRKQYNSWYDNMMNITDESIAASFNGAEKGLTEAGIEPLDSYVVDDGWNNYYDGTYMSKPSSSAGTTPNQTDFWEFNAKFPNELYTSTALADKLQSTFGLWLGPQGGYTDTYPGDFAQNLQAKGTGFRSSGGAICVAADIYVKNLTKLFIDYEKRFNIDYWKWDGFALNPCTIEGHGHMTGGYENMYYTTDLWEKWTDLFEAARAARAEEGKGLFINATCYVNLSPWLLQWVNTIWVQDSGDTGQIEGDTGARHEQKIYYRDQVYYNLYIKNQVQFPAKNIYNHDPIYGVSDKSNATTEVFREFLFDNAMRGTAFWELYFSPSIMDDAKWKVASDALRWAEENHEVLKNAKYYGNDPVTDEIYGYSCWNGGEGIISFVNPKSTEQTYEIKIDELIGAGDKTMKNVPGIQVYPYDQEAEVPTVTYGQKIQVTVPANDSVIWHFGSKDTQAPEAVSVKSDSSRSVIVKFDERVKIADAVFKVNGTSAAAAIGEDYRTVTLSTGKPIVGEAVVTIEGVTDMSGNSYQNKKTIMCNPDGVIARADSAVSLEDAKNVEITSYDAGAGLAWIKGLDKGYKVKSAGKLEGNMDFSLVTGVKTTASNVKLVSAGDEVELAIDKDGYIRFTVAGQSVTGKETVTTVTKKAEGTFGTSKYKPTQTTQTVVGKVNDGQPHAVTAVREANGVLKLYIDGQLRASAYDEAASIRRLSGADIMFGGDGLTGEVLELKVLNYALGYDEVPSITTGAQEAEIEWSKRSGWKANACSETAEEAQGDWNAAAAIDGDRATWWHTNYAGLDTCGTNHHWIEVTFQQPETFDWLMYVGRAGGNGTYKDYKLEIKEDAQGSYKEIKSGTFSTEKAENIVQLDKSYTAYAIKLTAISATSSSKQTFGSAVEINVGKTTPPYTKEETAAQAEALEKELGTVDASLYTQATVNAYNSVMAKIEKVTAPINRGSWDLLAQEARQAKAALVPVKEIQDALSKAGASYQELSKNPAAYTRESYNEFMEAYEAAKWAETYAVTTEEIKEAARELGAVTLKKRDASLFVFTDVDPNDARAWFRTYVYDAAELKVMTGKTSTTFAPNEKLPRAQFAAVIWKMEGYPAYGSVTETKFKDVNNAIKNSGIWMKDPIVWATEHGIITGYEDTGEFKPAKNISRQEMAVIMWRYAKYKGYSVDDKASLESFPDHAMVSGFAQEAMAWCVAKGIITGDQGRLNPLGDTNRAECATIIKRFIEAYE